MLPRVFRRAARGTHGESWERPSIQSADAWLASCWQEMRYNVAEVPVLLSTAQELVLWREVIAAEGDDLLNAEATADLARRAALTIAEWGIPLDAPEWGENEDALRFRASSGLSGIVRAARFCHARRSVDVGAAVG